MASARLRVVDASWPAGKDLVAELWDGDDYVGDVRADSTGVNVYLSPADGRSKAIALQDLTEALASARAGLERRGGHRLQSFEIKDDLATADERGIEVHVAITGGADRWCVFMTPAAMANCGDLLPHSAVRIHLGALHVMVVSHLTADIVRQTLEAIDEEGELFHRTRPSGRS